MGNQNISRKHNIHRQTNQRSEWHEFYNDWNATQFLSKTKTLRQQTADPINVRFSNRPFGVKRFQGIHWSVSTSLAGSRFSSESAPGPFHHGVRERGGTIYGAALPAV